MWGRNAQLTAQLKHAYVWHKIWNTTSLPGPLERCTARDSFKTVLYRKIQRSNSYHFRVKRKPTGVHRADEIFCEGMNDSISRFISGVKASRNYPFLKKEAKYRKRNWVHVTRVKPRINSSLCVRNGTQKTRTVPTILNICTWYGMVSFTPRPLYPW
jgi:hypothetical protein